MPLAAQMFGENQGRYVVTVAEGDDYRVIDRAKELGVATQWGGTTGEDFICVGDGPHAANYGVIPLADLRRAHEGFFPALMGADGALA